MIAGIGCRAGVSGEQVEAALDAAVQALGVNEHGQSAAASNPTQRPHIRRLTAIATPVAKANEPGIRAAATARGLPLLAIEQADLETADAGTVTRSAHSLAAMKVHSVAEAAALAGATHAGAGRTPLLLLPRIALGPVTCALAEST